MNKHKRKKSVIAGYAAKTRIGNDNNVITEEIPTMRVLIKNISQSINIATRIFILHAVMMPMDVATPLPPLPAKNNEKLLPINNTAATAYCIK